ncbi:MAG: sigma factor-like helix-turn-helix DNA-binding protein [Deferribacterales bacterium]
MNLKNFFIRKCSNIPALRDVLKTDNKSACSFFDISEIEGVLQTEIDNSNSVFIDDELDNDLITNSDETIRILLGILEPKEEQVFRYRFGLTQRGKLTQKECGEIFNCTDKNVLKIEKEAVNKIKEFIKEEKINKDMSISLLKEKVAQYQKKLKPIKFDGYFELGNLANAI